MWKTSLVVVVAAIFLETAPVLSHRLITNPYAEQEWDSVIVSSDPIIIKEKKSETTVQKPILKPQKRSYEECPENDFKCIYGNNDDKDINHIVDKFVAQYSDSANVKFFNEKNETEENEGSGKSYWSMIDSQTHYQPYNDKKNWVTLDPVPWSASKISKWHPNKVGFQQENKPWSYGSTTQRPVQQFWVSGSNLYTQRPTTQWGLGTNDLITDNRPGDFPTGSQNAYGLPFHEQIYHQDNNFNEYAGNQQDYQSNQGFKGNHLVKIPQNNHPSTYPGIGNGEWILLSTTKGYSIPQRHRWSGKIDSSKTEIRSRKLKPVEISRYHEEDLTDKFKLIKENATEIMKLNESLSTSKSEQKANTAAESRPSLVYKKPSKNNEPVKIIRRKVRLQVLPSSEKNTTSHGGLLEVDSNPQTVEEAQKEDEKLNKLKAIANIKKNKIRGYKLVPVNKSTQKGISQKSKVTLAAVGAGMIPATMALLVPMALGRRKRSLTAGHSGYEKIYKKSQNIDFGNANKIYQSKSQY